jgi:hypothetical protein
MTLMIFREDHDSRLERERALDRVCHAFERLLFAVGRLGRCRGAAVDGQDARGNVLEEGSRVLR